MPLISAEKVSFHSENGLSILSIKMNQGATIAIHLPDDTLAQLREILKLN
jgi:hypothetical protein